MRTFPILERGMHSVPWEVIEPHREQAQRNHGQSLERLADRGGLGFFEFWCVMNDISWINVESEFAKYEKAGEDLVRRLNLDR